VIVMEMKVSRINNQGDRVLLFDNLGYHVIAPVDVKVTVGDIIECEPVGVNFGWYKGVKSLQSL